MRIDDTIAAISTPYGKGGVAMIRISGAEAVEVASKMFKPASGTKLSEISSNLAVYGRIYEPFDLKNNIDDGIATIYRAPRSFTGEDTVEICCHGGILVTQTVLGAAFSAGARCAEPGEFTRRAFVNGKLGLSQAEALAALLEANTHSKMLLARSGLDGRVSQKCREIYNALCLVASSVYARIDYPDEDLGTMSRDDVEVELERILSELSKLADTYKSGHAIAEGIRTVICGKPNVGKSSLYNKIVGREAAIVTDIAGTTRDILEDTVPFGKVTLRLCDTAGLRSDSDYSEADVVERIGIDRAYGRLEDAELILAVFDSSKPLDKEDLELISLLGEKSGVKIAVFNKADKSGDLDVAENSAELSGFSAVVKTSTVSDVGIETLQRAVEDLFTDGSLDLSNDAIVASARQNAALSGSIDALRSAIGAVRLGLGEDIYCSNIEEAMSAICELDGRQVSEDIVAGIFSHFCVGK